MKKYSAALFLIILIAPSIAFASWWNPFSWNWKNLFVRPEVTTVTTKAPTTVEPIKNPPSFSQQPTPAVNPPVPTPALPKPIPTSVVSEQNPPAENASRLNSKPSLTLLSPNGGEVFRAGDTIQVKWSGSNVSNISFPIRLRYYDENNMFMGNQDLAFFVPGDSWSKSVEIPTTLQQMRNVYRVTKYKINIGEDPETPTVDFPSDMSDNFFTIKRKPDIGTEYAIPSSTSAELFCSYKYQYGTDNPEIRFEYGEKPCTLTTLSGSTPSCTQTKTMHNSETYATPPVRDTTERLFNAYLTIQNLKPNTEYNYQCVVTNSNGTAIGYENMSPTTYVDFKTTP